MTSIWGNISTQYFYDLRPDVILDAVSNAGLKPTGAINILNSMENRVYDLGIETNEQSSETSVICKFYRPGRWSREQIIEEHVFLKSLNQSEVPVIAPLEINDESLFVIPSLNIYYAFFKKEGGRSHDELNESQLAQLGRLLARLHLIGKQTIATTRIKMTPEVYLNQNLKNLLSLKVIPSDFEARYKGIVLQLLEKILPLFDNVCLQRIHGDCHLSNIIWQEDTALLIDFDDMVMGPPIQDIWLLVPGQDNDAEYKRQILLDAYEVFLDFDYSSLRLIEPLRAMRYVNFATWLSRRADDPAFKRTYLHFYQSNFWEQEIDNLQEQLLLI
tara:strand:- start:380 stop:1369 length:990 start_codon:yes stop_codon:yes gene_type:complete